MQNLFISYRTFYKNRHLIKDIYINSTTKQKQHIKRYLYSIAIIKPYHKDIIWEYLNEPIDSDYYVSNNTLRKEYRKAKIWK